MRVDFLENDIPARLGDPDELREGALRPGDVHQHSKAEGQIEPVGRKRQIKDILAPHLNVVNQVVPPILNEIDWNNNSAASSPRADITSGGRKKSMGKARGKEAMRKGWVVPEENRVRLMVVDFHIPERYIKVKCHKALLRADGTREERETVIAW